MICRRKKKTFTSVNYCLNHIDDNNSKEEEDDIPVRCNDVIFKRQRRNRGFRIEGEEEVHVCMSVSVC